MSGFFTSDAVLTALVVGTLVALVTSLVGVFTVTRGQSFAGHALADMGAVGGSAAYLLGVNQLWGFVGASVIAAAVMELVGLKRIQGRDVATGIVFGSGLGLTALFLYLDTTIAGSSNAAISVLFGSLFVVAPGTVPLVIVLSVIALSIIALTYRWLQFDAIDADMARVRGVPVRLAGVLFLGALALAVALSAVSIGAILSTALLIGPAATALRVTRTVGTALAASVAIGIGATWAGIVIAYFSFDWMGGSRSWPVSFCIVAIVFLAYLASGPVHERLHRHRDDPLPAGEHH